MMTMKTSPCEMIGGPLDGDIRDVYVASSTLHFPVQGTFRPNVFDMFGNVVRKGHMDLHVYRRISATELTYRGINAF